MRAAAIGIVSVLMTLHVSQVAAQNFDERWTIIPKAHAEPAPKVENQNQPDPHPQPSNPSQRTRTLRTDSTQRFSGRASFYSYRRGETASGSLYNRELPTAAHRNLPFGTKVRVTNLANNRSVIVTINDRGPWVRGRVLDLSLAAARALGISDHLGIADIRGEVL